MSFVEGQSLASIKRGEHERFHALRKRIGRRLLLTLADAWGYMIFGEGLFNADFHPGNILIMPEVRRHCSTHFYHTNTCFNFIVNLLSGYAHTCTFALYTVRAYLCTI
jgi:predicted unusual protein kinase regulating ubiquinone biosynthesis (AarF/ABC1/UbiB family)